MIKENKMFIIYMARMVARVIIFVLVGIMYLLHKEWLTDIMTTAFFHSFSPLHILWAILMAGMVIHLLPKFKISMGEIKSHPDTYRAPENGYDRLQLLEYVQQMNIRAWMVLLDWGHMMMYTPMLFIPSFFSWSLLFLSLIVAIRWEFTYAQHPERFWRGSNAAIRCENCQDHLCKIKKPLLSGIDRVVSSLPTPVDKLSANAEELDKEFDDGPEK